MKQMPALLRLAALGMPACMASALTCAFVSAPSGKAARCSPACCTEARK